MQVQMNMKEEGIRAALFEYRYHVEPSETSLA
jgi:hypothetical protein